MAVNIESVDKISAHAQKQQDEFKAMYKDIHDKIEKDYGEGNGDYELYDECNLYELVPERLPVNKVSSLIVKGLVGALV